MPTPVSQATMSGKPLPDKSKVEMAYAYRNPSARRCSTKLISYKAPRQPCFAPRKGTLHPKPSQSAKANTYFQSYQFLMNSPQFIRRPHVWRTLVVIPRKLCVPISPPLDGREIQRGGRILAALRHETQPRIGMKPNSNPDNVIPNTASASVIPSAGGI